jgi:hypothetical protein
MNNTVILIIGLIILFGLCYYNQSKEYFIENQPKKNSNNQNTNSNSYLNEIMNNGNNEYSLNKDDMILGNEINIDNNLDKPVIILESIGNTKLILHWQNTVPDNFSIVKYIINVYKCPGIVGECDFSKAEKITSYNEPNNSCTNCYLIINDLNMSENTYFIEMQIVYQNNQTSKYVITPKEVKTSKQEVEQNLNNLYKDALEHLIESNMQEKQVEMEQHLQKNKIDGLRTKITTLKTKLLHSDKYANDMTKIIKPPYPIKTYYNKTDMFDPLLTPQQTINYDNKEYYIGLMK